MHHRFTAVLHFGLLIALLLSLFSYQSVQAAPPEPPTDLLITLRGTSDFYVDSNGFCSPPGSIEGPDGMWLPVMVQNTGVNGYTYTGLVATVNPPANVVVDDASRYIGTLGPGASANVFYFFDYRALRTLGGCNDGTDGWYDQGYSITVTSVDNDLTAPYVYNDSFTNLTMISAAAGGALASDFLGPGAGVGQVFLQTITYDFGNNPDGSALFLQPNGNGNFNDQCYRLVGSRVAASSVAGVTVGTTDTLFFPSVNTANGNTVQVEFRWLVLCDPGTVTNTYPWAEITSGTQYKYDEGGYVATSFPLPDPASGLVTISKSVSPSTLPAGGVATFTVTLANSYNQVLYVDRITDVLPAGITFIDETAGSSVTGANSSLSPAGGATGTIDWYGIPSPTAGKTYAIPANGSIQLIYTANVQNVAGSYTNSATALVGNTPIGPAAATVIVGTPSFTITKNGTLDMSVIVPPARADAGDVINYSILITNTGNLPLTGLTVGDARLSNLDCDGIAGAPYVTSGMSLPVGGSRTCTGSYTLTQADLDTNGGG